MFYPPEIVEQARRNPELVRWCSEQAAPWLALEDDALWDLVFGNTITRSWMVWSDGLCPACGQAANMYAWKIDPFAQPWKLRCPHCDELFPKNDFADFYRSGLDRSAVFDPRLANRDLLIGEPSSAHPERPLSFGVDDGEGYVEADGRWRFIGTYLIYGLWKGQIISGIERLAAAYTVTGDPTCARKAGILLDRLSDLYPTFDFAREGLVYEKPGKRGYVSNWHDACNEVQTLCLAYDQLREILSRDQELSRFLSRKADEFELPTPKSSAPQICQNIEERIFRDTLQNVHKIESNFPTTDMAGIVIRAVLDGGDGDGREDVYSSLDEVLRRATRVDGVSGEKGVAGYSSIAPKTLAKYLALFARADATFLSATLARVPEIAKLYRFHIDTWCMQTYYPSAGDSGAFARPGVGYVGAIFDTDGRLSLAPSMFSFFWQLWEATGDAAFAQVLYHANGDSVEGLPHSCFADDPARFQQQVREFIDSDGATPVVGSVNKESWHLAILRAGSGAGARALWLDYDSGEPSGLYDHRLDPKVRGRGGHSHADGLNLGLYYRGLDLMPDFGYPPVNFGGWESPRAEWYKMTAAHNTVVVDGLDHATAGGETTLWADGDQARGLRVSAPELIGEIGHRFERTLFMVDSGPDDSYVVDLFRVGGGADHARFMHSHFAELETSGLSLKPADDFGHGTMMRSFQIDESPAGGWFADWKVVDRYGLAPPDADIHLRYTDLTIGAQALTCEGWVMAGYYANNEEVWIPRVLVRRRSDSESLHSTFVGVIEPYDGNPGLCAVARMRLETAEGGESDEDADVALEMTLSDGRRDLVVAADTATPPAAASEEVDGGSRRTLIQPGWDAESDGQLALVRCDPAGRVARLALCGGTRLRSADLLIELARPVEFIEIDVSGEGAVVVAGDAQAVAAITRGGRTILG